MSARVTVGIPFYNAERTLALAVRSVFAQTYTDWELLLVDDGSTDGSLAIARAIAHPAVRVISDGVNRKVSYRLNQIAQMARGDYIARMDADDVMHPERLARQVAYLDAHPEVDVLDAGVYVIGADNRLLGARALQPLDLRPLSVLTRGLMVHPAVIARREWFGAHRYRDDFPRGQDRELWCAVFSTTSFARLAEPLLFYRDESGKGLEKRAQGYVAAWRAALRHGPRLVGWPLTFMALGVTASKLALLRLSALVGFQGLVWRLHNAPLSSEAAAEAAAILARVAAAAVPGLEPQAGGA